jgi:hypothetical protein
MMEAEIERTRKGICGIDDASEKAEQVLAKVTRSEHPSCDFCDDSVEGIIAKEGREDKMQDNIHEYG